MPPLQQNADWAYLIVEQNRRWSDVYRLPTSLPTVIGRSSDCDLTLADDRSSRRHAQIERTAGGWVVSDLGSRNGTLLDGRPLEGPTAIGEGQTISIGDFRLRFTQQLRSVAASPPAAEAGGQHTGSLAVGGALPVVREQAEPRRWLTTVAMELLECDSFETVVGTALQRILAQVRVAGGAIYGVSSPPEKRPITLEVLATAERPGKAYHRVSDFLLDAAIDSGQAILARNVAADQAFTPASTSLAAGGTSVVAAPIFDADSTYGLIHLYSRDDEPELSPAALADVTAAAEMLSVLLPQVRQRLRLQRSLKSSRRTIASLQDRLAAAEEGAAAMLGSSAAIVRLREQLTRVAASGATVLLRGESGVGKELAARFLHGQSRRRHKPLLAINCAALSPMLLESELFGYEKGAFTGAAAQRAGKFELADGGTLLLDEVGEMSPETQAKFLRVLEGHSFERVGGSESIRVDVRIVAATNRDLERSVSEGTFRADLYYRLRVVELFVPPLRERVDDIVPLAESFLARYRETIGGGPSGFSEAAVAAMRRHSWPGNIRELKNAVERAAVLGQGPLATAADLALSSLRATDDAPVGESGPDFATHDAYRPQSLAELERQHIAATLEFTGGQKSRAAAILGIERSTLDRKLKRYDEASPAGPPP